jgi:hypothetical protein
MKENNTSNTDWRDYRLLVLQKLEELDNDLKEHAAENRISFKHVEKRLAHIETEIATQKTKLSFIGAVWGFVSGIAASVITALVVSIFGK